MGVGRERTGEPDDFGVVLIQLNDNIIAVSLTIVTIISLILFNIMTAVIMLPIVEALVEDEKAGYSSKGTGQAIEVLHNIHFHSVAS